MSIYREMVEISHGVFAGYEGIFEERLKGDERVRVLLKMLSDRYVPAEVAAGWNAPRECDTRLFYVFTEPKNKCGGLATATYSVTHIGLEPITR